MQVVFVVGKTGRGQIDVENLVADPVQRIEPAISFVGVLLALGFQGFLGDRDLVFQVGGDVPEALLEFVALGLACAGAEHAVCEAVETARHEQGVDDGKTARAFELAQFQHGCAAVEADADILVANASGVAGRAGQPDLVGFGEAGAGILDIGHAREPDRQAVEIIRRCRLQAGNGRRRRLGLDAGGVHKTKAAQGFRIDVDGFRTWYEADALEIMRVRQAGPAR